MDKNDEHYKSVVTKIILLSRFRDAVRQVSIDKIFKTAQRRDEFYMAIIEALEDLEDELEEIEEADMKNAEKE